MSLPLLDLFKQNLPNGTLSTPESPVSNRNLIWSARWSLSDRNSLNTKLYETSVQELIGTDGALEPFFDTAWRDHYDKLWLPTATGSPDLVLNSSSSSLMKQGENSWFLTRESREDRSVTNNFSSPTIQMENQRSQTSERISYPSFMFSPVATMERGSTPDQEPPKKRMKKSERLEKKGKLLRCRKLRIKPTQEQIDILKTCIGIHRYIYNECVQSEKNGLVNGVSNVEKNRVRSLLTNKSNYKDTTPWKDSCPCHAKQQAVEEFFRAKKAAISNVRNGHQECFEIGFRSRFKSPTETIPWEKYKFQDERVYEGNQYVGEAFLCIPYNRKYLKIPIRGKLPSILKGRVDSQPVRDEVKIIKDRLGNWFAVISIELEQERFYVDNPMGNVVAFDPGCSTFQTWYSNDGTWGEIGKFFPQERLLRKADNLKSILDSKGHEKNSRWRRRMKRRFLALLQKIRNRTADLHNKVCSWVTKRFRLIILPAFKTSEMVSSGNLHSKTCRKMMTWSHYTFKRKLVEMAQKYEDVKVRIGNESYTTKTCGRCGVINETMTLADRIFKCSNCGIVSSRDGHAARNIAMRSLPYLLG